MSSFVKNVKSGVIRNKINGNMLKNMRKALFFVTISAQNIAPIDIGRLRQNVRKEIERFGKDGYYGAFTFRQPYSKVQHEHTEFHHFKGGQAKYVKKVLNRNFNKVMKMFAKGVIG